MKENQQTQLGSPLMESIEFLIIIHHLVMHHLTQIPQIFLSKIIQPLTKIESRSKSK